MVFGPFGRWIIKIRIRTIPVLLILLALSRITRAAGITDTTNGYSLDAAPDGWTAASQADVDAYNKQNASPVTCLTIFRPTGDDSSNSVVLISALPIPENEAGNSYTTDDLKQMMDGISKSVQPELGAGATLQDEGVTSGPDTDALMDKSHSNTTQLFTNPPGFQCIFKIPQSSGDIRSVWLGYCGKHRILFLTVNAQEADWDKYTAAESQFLTGFRLTSDEQGEFDSNGDQTDPHKYEKLGESIGKIAGPAIVIVVAAVVTRVINKKKKNRIDPPPPPPAPTA